MGPVRALLALAALLSCTSLRAQDVPSLDPEVPPTVVRTGPSPDDRVTIPIMIDGKGPWNFIVDTGAQRTVITHDVAQRLALPKGTPVTVISMAGQADVDTVALGRLSVGDDMIEDIQAPVLEADHLGAPGLLGLDGLHEKRLLLDFRAGRITISASRARIVRDPDTIIVQARRRKGQLILLDSDVNGMAVSIVLDTGTAISVGNEALLRKLVRQGRPVPQGAASITSVTGGVLSGPSGVIESVRMGPVTLKGVPVLFADATVFDQLGLKNKPALMLGVDALRLFDRVAIDFGRGKVDFLLPDSGALVPRFAGGQRPMG